MRALFLPVLVLLASAGLDAQRVRPPDGIPCSRDELTSYTGEITAYSRTKERLNLTLHTDADTVEKFSMKAPVKMLFQGAPFRQEHWKEVEEKAGKLKRGVRATVWECKTGARVLDWRAPAE